MNISILETKKDYVVLKVPRRLMEKSNFQYYSTLNESDALRILRAGMREYKQGRTKVLKSLRSLRHGD
ncbi:MAG: hypothetical protein HY452_02340 [Parcubacteria group bacterium]|nr:hypothetical protein [Parcubacteria group bacterium]